VLVLFLQFNASQNQCITEIPRFAGGCVSRQDVSKLKQSRVGCAWWLIGLSMRDRHPSNSILNRKAPPSNRIGVFSSLQGKKYEFTFFPRHPPHAVHPNFIIQACMIFIYAVPFYLVPHFLSLLSVFFFLKKK
jgi:hypothetical protein